MNSVRIRIIIPKKTKKEEIELSKEALPEDVEVVGLAKGEVLEGRSDSALVMAELINSTKEAEREGCDAVVIACHGDPGLEVLRDLVDIPVLGPGQVGMHICSMLGYKFSMITLSERLKMGQQFNVSAYGLNNKLASIRTIGYTIDEILEENLKYERGEPAPSIRAAVAECVKAIKEDGATIIMIACGTLKWMAEEVQNRLKEKGYDVPVVNPLPITVEIAKALVKCKLTHSRLAYVKPK